MILGPTVAENAQKTRFLSAGSVRYASSLLREQRSIRIFDSPDVPGMRPVQARECCPSLAPRHTLWCSVVSGLKHPGQFVIRRIPKTEFVDVVIHGYSP